MSFTVTSAGWPPFDLEEALPTSDEVWAERERQGRREPLRVWHAALQVSVTAVSPALVDMAAVRGVDLRRAVKRLRPPPTWRGGFPQPIGGGWEDVWPCAPDPGRRDTPWGRLGRTRQAVRSGAVPADHPEGAFFVALDGRSLSGCAKLGEAHLLTHGGLLQIWFEQTLPDTLMLSIEGRRVDHLIDHPVLTGRAYPIVRAFREDDWTVLEVETGLVPFAMPWPHLVNAVAAQGGPKTGDGA